MIKFDAFGNQEWQKVYGGSDDDRGQEIINTSDGGYAIIGSSKSQDGDVSLYSGFNDFWVLKISNSGNLIWEKSTNGEKFPHLYSNLQIDNVIDSKEIIGDQHLF